MHIAELTIKLTLTCETISKFLCPPYLPIAFTSRMTCFHFPEIRRCRFCRAIPSNSTLVKMKLLFLLLLLWRVLGQGVSGVGPDGVAVNVMEGDSVTLNTSVKTNQQEKIRWYFNAIRIAEISGDLSHICRDVQCNKGTERFRGRLKLDHQTGSLTITNTRTTDSGNYHLKISNSYNSDSGKTFIVAFHGVSGVSPDGVSVFVMEEDSVTLNTGVKTNQDRQDRIRWYFNDTRIAQISVALSKICTDVQCNGGTERFRDRLKLDHQTGSLTIMNITNTDTGHYILKISSRNNNESIKTFIFAVHGVFAAERDEMKRKSVKEGEAVTLDPCEVKNPNDLMTWYFNDMPMAKINRDLSHICTDDQFRERFRDTLKLDHQTGSLTITNTRTTDSALYKLQINSSRFSIIRSFNVTVTGVTVTAVSDPRPPSAAAAVIRAAVIVSVIVGALLVAGVIYYRYRRSTQATQNETGMPHNDHQNGIPMQVRGPLIQPSIHYCPLINGRSPNQNGAPSVANGTSQLHNLLFK